MMVSEDGEHKHVCKFCSKSFPCGRSLGGHMRSHLITITSSDHCKSGRDLGKKRLPPVVTDGGKPNRALKFGQEDALLGRKHCRECGKSFHSCKALFGHMKCHSVSARAASSVEEDSWSMSKQVIDSESDNEPATSTRRRKRSDRTKRCIADANFSPSEIEQMEQEEVALSLIILSKDKGDWSGPNSFVESSDNSSLSLQPKTIVKASSKDSIINCDSYSKFKQPMNRKAELTITSHNISGSMSEFSAKKSRKQRCHETSDSAPNAPTLLQDFETTRNKFRCSICKKGFSSYQALGGHRASHKKYKGCCSTNPPGENSLTVSEVPKHECPVCFKVFPSGQALGGHKRSHLCNNQTKTEAIMPRGFLDLNLPAPDDEEECSELKPWWIGDAHEHELLLTC